MCVERIKASSRHLMGLVNDVLDLSRIEAGKITVSRANVPLGDTVQQAIEMVLPQARVKGVEVRSEFHCEGDVTYAGDADRTRQVLMNLLSNAVKFTPRGGRITSRCAIRRRADAESEETKWVAIDVEDTGVGIDDAQLDRIFVPFVQLDDSSTRNVGGAGLGLTISRQLARMMDGDLTVSNRPGEGACFTLWLKPAD
jgi:signal transduction histidine kinase